VATVSQKRLLISQNHTIDVLYLLAALGSGAHRLVLVHRHQGRIVEAADYDHDECQAIKADIIESGEVINREYDTLNAPSRTLRVDWAQSSNGDLVINIKRESVTLHRQPTGNYQVTHASTNQPTPSPTEWPHRSDDGSTTASQLLGSAATAPAAGGTTAAIVPTTPTGLCALFA
jgi:hypothetical protein